MTRTVLVCVDDPSLRSLIAAALKSQGYFVHAVGDGRAAERLLEQHAVDLIVTDLEMPEFDGFSLATWVRDHLNHPPAVIAISGRAQFFRERALAAGAAEVLAKPFPLGVLHDLVGRFIRPEK
jgi:CheY-like chemotaxis protein